MLDLSVLRHQSVRVLVVKLSSLGDIIHVTGCLRAMRASLPHARISVAVEERWRDVLRHCPHVDALVTSSSRSRLSPAYLLEIRRAIGTHGPFDLAIDLQGTRRSAAWVYLSGAPLRAGRGSFRPGWRHTLAPDLTRHAVDVCADVCRSIGLAVDDPSPELHTGLADESSLDRTLQAAGLDSAGHIVINPFSRWLSKSWPLPSAAAVIGQLMNSRVGPMVISGGPEDKPAAGQLQRLLGDRAVPSLVGKLTLGEALCLLRRSRLVVSCDSGPMHAAAAFGVPVVALFGPTHPERTGPWGAGHTVVQALRPERHQAYRTDPLCLHMRAMDSAAILDAVGAQLGIRALS